MSSKAPSSIVQSSFFSRHKKTLKHLGILWLAFFVLVAVMLPFREAGFQDDYEYHHAVRNLLNTGVFKNSEITIVTFIFQGYWGALFSHLFGFSYTTLQAATLTLFFFGISAFYLTLLELFSDRKKALFFSLFLLFSPPLLRYAFSFMTDIPYLSLFLLSIYFAVMTMRTGSLRYAILTGSIGACSFFTRNLGIFVPFGLLVVFLLRSYPNKTKYLPHIFTLFLFLAGMFLGYAYWLFALSNVTQNQLQYADRMGNIMFHWNPLHFAHIPAISSQYREYMHRLFYYSSYFLGFFGIPLALTVFLRRGSPYFEKLQKKNVLAGIALVGFIACMPLLFYPPEWERFAVFHAPEFVDGILFKLLGSVHYKDVIWTIMMLLSFPFWVLFLPDCLKRLHQLFLRKRQHIFIRDYFLGIGIAFLGFLYIIYKVQSIYGFNFFRDSFVFLFYFFIAIIFFTSRFFFRLRRNIPITISSFGIFFLFLFFTHLFFTVLAFGRGDEYLLPFYPLFILFLAWSFDMRKLSKAGMLTALLVLALVSVMYARRDYQHVGIIWEEYTSLLGRGVVNVRNSDDFALAWRRYHFQEPSFQKMLKKTNGDKRLIPLKSWESMEEYQKQSKEPYVSVDLCGNIIHRKGEKLIRRFEEKSLFMDDSYCVVLFPPGTF